MKLQIQGQTIRLRIDEDELARLRAGEAVENAMVFSENHIWHQSIHLVMYAAATVVVEANGWSFRFPAEAVEALVQQLPCREGLRFSVPVNAGQEIELIFEVDVRDSTRNRTKRERIPSRHGC